MADIENQLIDLNGLKTFKDKMDISIDEKIAESGGDPTVIGDPDLIADIADGTLCGAVSSLNTDLMNLSKSVTKEQNNTTEFNSDGSITVINEDNSKVITTFNEDGSIKEISYNADAEITMVKTTTFNEDGSITEEIERGDN